MSALALPWVGLDSAISEEARRVRTLTAFPMTETPDGRRRRWALHEVWSASSVPDWDGYGAAPVTPEARAAAEGFLRALPTTWLSPETAADPDGEISFEWVREPHWVFTVSVSPERRLSYAGLFGANRVHGAESFLGQLPQAIVDNLVRFFRGADRSTR